MLCKSTQFSNSLDSFLFCTNIYNVFWLISIKYGFGWSTTLLRDFSCDFWFKIMSAWFFKNKTKLIPDFFVGNSCLCFSSFDSSLFEHGRMLKGVSLVGWTSFLIIFRTMLLWGRTEVNQRWFYTLGVGSFRVFKL